MTGVQTCALPIYTPSIQSIVDRGYLVIGICKIDQPPFYAHDTEGQLKGYDIDIAKGLADGLGVKLKIDDSAKNWDDLIPLLLEEKIDLAISFLSKTIERSKSILFSQSYAKINQALLVNRLRLSQAKIKGLNTLEKIFSKNTQEELIVYEGSSYVKFAQDLFGNDVKLAPYKNQDEIIKKLLNGNHTAFLTDQLEINNYVDANPESKLKLLPIILKKNYDLIAIGIPVQNKHLQHYVNNYLETQNIFIELKTKENKK